jgi:hypothetical protein
MSAIILQFPTKAVHVAVAAACIDILPVDKRGSVILDACVSQDLVCEFLRLLHDFGDRGVEPVPHGVEAYPPELSLVQCEVGGSYLIEARIPLAVATAFRELATGERKTAV